MTKKLIKAAMVQAVALAQKYAPAQARGAPGALFAKATDGAGELYIYEQIGESFWASGITANGVRHALEALAGVKTLRVFINSPGGDVFEAKGIYTQLRRFAESAKVIVHVDGLAASAASFLAMAGDEIRTEAHATWMIHNVWTVAAGDAADLRATADLLEKVSGEIAEIYAARSKQPVEKIREMLDAETWLTADEAAAVGLTDVVEPRHTGAPTEADEAAAAKSSRALALLIQTQARLGETTARTAESRRRRS